MMNNKVAIGMIVLNEEEFISKNLHQHYYWEGMDVRQIIIVEGSVKLFPKTNLTGDGFSSDDTVKLIKEFPDPDKKITLVQDRWEDKVQQRNQYVTRIKEDIDYLIVIDCDEFYTKDNQIEISKIIKNNPNKHSFLVPQKHLWHCRAYQVTGGYWDIPHLRFYKWRPGCHYEKENHNELVGPDGHNYHDRDDGFMDCPDVYCVHCGFARSSAFCRDKQDYYYNRGEKVTRPMYSDCREAWFNWKYGDPLPHGAKVVTYQDNIPECF